MSGIVTVLKGSNLTLTTAINNFCTFGTAAAGAAAARAKIRRLEIWQRGTTTLQMLEGEIATRTGGAVTATSRAPVAIRPILGQASGIAGSASPVGGAALSGINASVDATPTYAEIWPFGFANTNGYMLKPDPDEEIIIPASTFVTIRLTVTPSTLTGWGFVLVLEEE